MKKILSLLSIAAMTILSLSFISPTYASSIDEEQAKKFAEQVKFVEENAIPLTGAQINETIQLVHIALENQQIVIYNQDELDFNNAMGYQFDESQNNIKTITIPFVGNSKTDVSSLNSLTVAFNSEQNIVEYSEIKVTEGSDYVTSTVYVNGEEAGSTSIEKSTEGFQTMGYIDRVNDCMARFGVNPDTAALAISTCGLVCTISLGTLCLPCLGTIGAAGGGVIVGCFISEW